VITEELGGEPLGRLALVIGKMLAGEALIGVDS
jgi:hypothetical protein